MHHRSYSVSIIVFVNIMTDSILEICEGSAQSFLFNQSSFEMEIISYSLSITVFASFITTIPPCKSQSCVCKG